MCSTSGVSGNVLISILSFDHSFMFFEIVILKGFGLQYFVAAAEHG
jgi:hypothetical protein